MNTSKTERLPLSPAHGLAPLSGEERRRRLQAFQNRKFRDEEFFAKLRNVKRRLSEAPGGKKI